MRVQAGTRRRTPEQDKVEIGKGGIISASLALHFHLPSRILRDPVSLWQTFFGGNE